MADNTGINQHGQQLGKCCPGHANKREMEDMVAGNMGAVMEPIGHNNHVAENQNLAVKGCRYAQVV